MDYKITVSFVFFVYVRRQTSSTHTYKLFPYTPLFQSPNGLVVPFVRNTDQKGIVQLAQETAELARKARDGKLKADEMKGGCFSISSLGGIGGSFFTPIVNAPEVAILGVSKSQIKPVWDGKQFAPRLLRPEERRVGKECVSTCRSRWGPEH